MDISLSPPLHIPDVIALSSAQQFAVKIRTGLQREYQKAGQDLNQLSPKWRHFFLLYLQHLFVLITHINIGIWSYTITKKIFAFPASNNTLTYGFYNVQGYKGTVYPSFLWLFWETNSMKRDTQIFSKKSKFLNY